VPAAPLLSLPLTEVPAALLLLAVLAAPDAAAAAAGGRRLPGTLVSLLAVTGCKLLLLLLPLLSLLVPAAPRLPGALASADAVDAIAATAAAAATPAPIPGCGGGGRSCSSPNGSECARAPFTRAESDARMSSCAHTAASSSNTSATLLVDALLLVKCWNSGACGVCAHTCAWAEQPAGVRAAVVPSAPAHRDYMQPGSVAGRHHERACMTRD
jgi:hypothetical protein